MSKQLKILIIEDSEDDTLLVLHELRKGGYDPVYERVETQEAMISALERQRWDIIISDYVLPKFSGLAALALYKRSGLDMPFLIVSGNIGEDVAVEAMRAGAHDYIIKGNLRRLVPAVERELRETMVRRERAEAEEAFMEQSRVLEAFFRHAISPLVFLDKEFNFIRVNDAYAKACQRDIAEFYGHNHFEFYPHEENEDIFRGVVSTKTLYQAVAKPFVFPDHPEWGVTYWDWTLVPVLDNKGEVDFLVFSLKDVTDRKEAEDRTLTHNKLLQLFSHSFSRDAYLGEVVKLISEWSGCTGVGISIMDKNDHIPYSAYTGFSPEFWESENWLSTDHDQCTCIRVIKESPDAGDLPYMTRNGSFYLNDNPGFMSGLTPEERDRFRDGCLKTGFKSLAVVPIRYVERVLGAVHLADERKEVLPLKKVEFIESITPLIGEAIYRFSIEDELRRNYDALQSSEKQLRDLSMHLQSAREEERTQIAREIHDELGQVLTALKMDVAWLRSKYKDREALVEKTGAMLKLIDMTIKTIKRISAELRPGLLDDLGLAPAIEWQAEEFQKRTGIICSVSISPKDISLDKDRSTAVFRIFQEALTNIARHARATKAIVALGIKDGKIVLRVEDNGKGITKKQLFKSGSFGLIGIRERVHFLSGEVDIQGVPNKGTSIAITIPLGAGQS